MGESASRGPSPAASRRRQAGPLVVGAVVLVLGLLAVAGYLLRDADEPTPASSSSPSAEPSSAAPSAAPTVAATPAATNAPSPAGTPTDTRPVAVGRGTPDCNGPCKVENRLTRAFLPRFAGQQTLLLASSTEADESGNFLHAFVVDDAGRVIWEEHGFGWTYRRVDEKFAVRFDDAGHVFFRAYVADFTYLYVLHTTGSEPRLVGPPDGEATDGFQDGQVVERPGEPAFRIRESVVDCPEDGETPVEACPRTERTFRWDGTRYVKVS